MPLELSEHARRQATRRSIAHEDVLAVASAPDQVIRVHAHREIRQSQLAYPPDGRVYLVRVIVDLAGWRERIVTVYRTSRVAKYWRDA